MSEAIGYLSPEGKLYACNSWGHTDLAEKLCRKLGIGDYSSIYAEDELLYRGYVCLRARDAYMNYYQKDRDYCNFLTSQQIEFLTSILNDVSCVDKYNDINEILEYQEFLNKYFNSDGSAK